MAADERNFRSSYYEKVGCYSVEEKKSLNKLLQDSHRNHSKLKQFCLSYTVPTDQRVLLWSIILGILPLHKNSTEYIIKELKEVYEDLMRAVSIMQYVDSTSPRSHIFYVMWLLENQKLSCSKNIRMEHDFVEIVKVLLEIFDDDMETYWIAKEFFNCACDMRREFVKLRDLTQNLLKRDDIVMHNHLDKLNIFDSQNLLNNWYNTGFAGVFSELSLVKVWDKICGGSRKIVVFVFLELMKTLRESVLKCQNQTELRALIKQVKDDAVIINKAIKNWQSNKIHSELTVH